MKRHAHTLGMGINIHHLHDEASTALAVKILEGIPGATRIREPVDDVGWSGVRIYDEEKASWVASLRWVRGASRDIEQAAKQLITAVTVWRDGELCKPKVPKKLRGKPGSSEEAYQSAPQRPAALRDELGIKAVTFKEGMRRGSR